MRNERGGGGGSRGGGEGEQGSVGHIERGCFIPVDAHATPSRSVWEIEPKFRFFRTLIQKWQLVTEFALNFNLILKKKKFKQKKGTSKLNF